MCHGNEDVLGCNSGESKLQCFSGEIRNFLQKDHEESLKLLSSEKNGKEKSFADRLKKSVKILSCGLSDSEVVLMKSFFKNKMTSGDEKLLLAENVLLHYVLMKLAKYLNRV